MAKRMRILLTCYFYLPSTAGLWPYVKELKQALEREGHEVDLLTHHPDVLKYYISNSGKFVMKYKVKYQVQEKVGPLYDQYFPGLDARVKDYEFERISFELAASCFDLWKYDLIHAQDVISARAMARIKPKQTPLIATLHGAFAHEQLLQEEIKSKDSIRWHYAMFRDHYGAIAADEIIVPSEWLKGMLIKENNVPSDNITVVPYGIHIDSFMERMEQTPLIGPPNNKRIIACPARLSVEKGHKYLLEALVKLKQERDDWVCWLMGDGVLRDELMQLTKECNLQHNVLFMGSQHNVPVLLKISDIFVLPSIQDNLPFAVMEAQLAGKPIVVTDAGGLPGMIEHNKTGLIAKAGSGESLYLNIKEALDNEALRESMGKNAREFGLSNWPIERMIAGLFAVYEETIKKGDKVRKATKRNQSSPLVSEQLSMIATPFDHHDGENLWKRLYPQLPSEYSILDSGFIRVLNEYKNYGS
ncbi:glycosyltransferase family 4 protein [Cohnella faecalis]|uniref:Glycosyltransferase family 1 protein n=1 Tax=Cohnella faecalis TaxID=2315694 RepID=A0A398CP08_9BACL|nr:glycosyltransferase family 4 protein [Cohnella faecalis]RIE04102.1 glycosyltransferase family 1 protein [Cohnella faecalis]